MNTSQTFVPVAARYSLRWRLPLLISCLIALVLATFLWAAYDRVEATLVRAAGERAQGAADQVSSLLDGRRTLQQLRQLSVDPHLRRFLETRSDDAREAARARLMALGGTAPRRFEVWDAAGALLLEISIPGASTTAGDGVAKVLPPGSPPSVAGISALQGSGDTVFLDTVAELRREEPAAAQASPAGRLGYARIRSTFVENPPGIFSRLVGPDALVRIGNRTGGVWTDISHVVPALPVDLARPGVAEYRASSGEMHLGAVSPIQATPWAVWVEFPLNTIIAPARLFLRGMIAVTLIFVAVAAVLAFALAARITAPLSEINAAAAAVAAGDYSRQVIAGRRDEIGQLGRTFNAMAADVQAAADALRTSEDSYRRLFASNPHPMWVYDVETLRFLNVNDSAIAHYGYSRDEFLAMTIKDIRPDDAVPALLESVARVGPTVNLSGIWKHRKKDGTLIDVEVSSHQLVLDGRPARAVLAHDVTERLEAQRALQESEETLQALNAELEQRVSDRTAQLEAANQELEAFSYSVSHDLRAPLRHVQGYVEMLTAATDGQLSGKAERYLKTITEATVEMGDLIDDLLAFSGIARARMSDGRVSLDDLVQDTIARLEMATRGRNIVWTIAALPTAVGDPSMLKQVYANLLGNAVKYSRQRDPAEIEIGCTGEEDGQCVLFVRDNGAGFDMRYVHKLFGVFQRLHRADEFEGTGIGLATVRRIITRHGGRTWAEGKVNEGATIYFTLPTATAQDQSSKES
jgi:PAS domain S-box-containing protein